MRSVFAKTCSLSFHDRRFGHSGFFRKTFEEEQERGVE